MTAVDTQGAGLDLFAGLDDTVSETAEQAVAELVSAMEPKEVERGETKAAPGFTAFWRRYQAAVREAEGRISEVISTSKELLGEGHSVGESISSWSLERKTQDEIVESLFRRAEREFAPPGGKLSISRSEIYEEVGYEGRRRAEDEFDPDRFWVAIERKYGGDAGKELGLKQTAESLVSVFSLYRTPPVHKANRLELVKCVWSEKRFRGGHELSYSAREGVVQTQMALASFCEWAGDVATAVRLRERCRSFGYSEQLVSRERFDHGGIGLVTYLEKFVYELYGDLGPKFQAFIGLYGRGALEGRD